MFTRVFGICQCEQSRPGRLFVFARQMLILVSYNPGRTWANLCRVNMVLDDSLHEWGYPNLSNQLFFGRFSVISLIDF